MRRSVHVLLWLLVVLLLGKAALALLKDREGAGLHDGGPVAMVILVQLNDDGEGCGQEFVSYEIPVVSTRLTSVLSALSMFGPPEGLRNPLKEQGLRIIGAEDGVIDLAGEPRLGGFCDRPRLKGQIERTAKLYGGEFEVRLNGSASEYQCMKDVWGKCDRAQPARPNRRSDG